MLEKRLYAVPPQLFTTDGTANGKITVSNTVLFKVKQVVSVGNSTLQPQELEIKRIDDINTMWLGPLSQTIDKRSDMSAYTVASGAFLFANEQKRPSIPLEEFTRATYEEEPVVAQRSVLVDKLGNKIDNVVDNNGINRLAVDGQFHAEVDVQVDVDIEGIYDPINNPDPDNIGVIAHNRALTPTDADQVNRVTSVTNGNVHAMDVSIHNSNGTAIDNTNPLPVVTVLGPGMLAKSLYNEVSSVASSILTTILTYTVPVATTAKINSVDVSGTNIAAYQVEVNSSIIDKKRTYFSGPLNEVFNFNSSVALVSGDVVTVRVIHIRPNVGDFNARVAVIEQT